MKRFHSIFVCTGLGLLSLTPGVAHADRETGLDTRSTWAPIAVIQSTPGVHITLSGGKLGIGASLDLLAGGALNGNRDFSIGPGIVGGGFAEVNAVRKEGVTTTLGWRVGGGALAPTLGGGYIPFGMVTYDWGTSWGAVPGDFTGIEARAIYFGAGVRRTAGAHLTIRGGLALPLLPPPAVS